MTERRLTNLSDAASLVHRVSRETFVRTVEVHEELASTNDRGLALASCSRTDLPCLIVAHRQTAGRGRGANRWWSSAGAVTFSLLLQPDLDRLPVARWPELSLTVGASVCQALRPLVGTADLRLKWPNDVYVSGRKICGVLVEVPPSPTERIVVGVGVNINNSAKEAPPELQQRAVALCDVVGAPCSPQDVLIGVLRSFEHHLDLLCDKPDEMRQLWRDYDLLIGRSVTVGDEHGTVSGTCEGIDDDGALLLRTEAGTQRIYGGVVQSFEE